MPQTPTEKLKFIQIVIDYRKQGYRGEGCPYDWFYSLYEEYKHTKTNNPKYIKVYKDIGYDISNPYILVEEGKELRYHNNSNMSIICEAPIIDADLLWQNGNQAKTLGYLDYRELTENDYIDWMYKQAMLYYQKDVLPMLNERAQDELLKATKQQFSYNYFRLKD